MTPWGYPAQPPQQSGSFSAFVTQYAPWLLIGGLVVLALATSGSSKK